MGKYKTQVLLYSLSVLFPALFIIFHLLYVINGYAWAESVYITFMTISYHFIMRLLVGGIMTLICKLKKMKGEAFWFQNHKIEDPIYKFLKVKNWKNSVSTFNPDLFDSKKNSLDTIIHNMCQAELVHEIIMILSFVPIVFTIWYGLPMVFILTSVFGAMLDLIFVIVQRYNRPRVIKLNNALKRRNAN